MSTVPDTASISLVLLLNVNSIPHSYSIAVTLVVTAGGDCDVESCQI